MSSTNAASTRICPVCDAPNSNVSLFCAECGSSLNLPSEGGDTSAYEPVETVNDDDAQQTAVFTPTSRTTESDQATRVTTPAATSEGTSPDSGTRAYPSASTWEPVTTTSADRAWPAETVAVPPAHPAAPGSLRGFFLGLFALLLVLAVLLLWIWAAIFSQDTRNSIQDFFGFIG
jgi:hypothetical protein